MKTKSHDGIRTTAALRQAIRESKDSIRNIARRYRINPKTVAKWRRRASIDDLKTGPKRPRSPALSQEAQALIVATRRQSGMSLDALLDTLRLRIPQLSRSSLHRCLQRHGISAKSASSATPSRATKLWDGPRPQLSPRARDPNSTREAILEAARSCLAHDGPEGLSLAEVARIAGVNRGTAYKHFQTREKLIAATADWVSEKLFRAVFGGSARSGGRRVEAIDVAEITDRLATFAMDNPELCRAWLLKVLSSPNPSSDRFWREYAGSTERFAGTKLAKRGIDTEVLSVIMLAGACLWPVWARAHSQSREDMRPLAYRFAQECLRISMYGNLRTEHFPEIATRLGSDDLGGRTGQ